MPKLLVFSAHDQAGVKGQAKEYESYFSSLEISPDHWHTYLNDLAFTLSFRRSSLTWKSFCVVQSPGDLLKLEKTISIPVKSLADPRFGFIFNGQGAQWARMDLELIKFPAFQQNQLDSEEELLNAGRPWRLTEELSRDKDSCINTPDFFQPICTAL